MDPKHQLVADLNNTLERIRRGWCSAGSFDFRDKVDRTPVEPDLCVLAAAAEVTTGDYHNWAGSCPTDRFVTAANALFNALPPARLAKARNDLGYYGPDRTDSLAVKVNHVASYNDHAGTKKHHIEELINNAISEAVK